MIKSVCAAPSLDPYFLLRALTDLLIDELVDPATLEDSRSWDNDYSLASSAHSHYPHPNTSLPSICDPSNNPSSLSYSSAAGSPPSPFPYLLTSNDPNHLLPRPSLLRSLQHTCCSADDNEDSVNPSPRDGRRCVFVSWIPRQLRATSADNKKAQELSLKRLLRSDVNVPGVAKVLLFPPHGSYTKIIFQTREYACSFLRRFGGKADSIPSERWKIAICEACRIKASHNLTKTSVNIEMAKSPIAINAPTRIQNTKNTFVRTYTETTADTLRPRSTRLLSSVLSDEDSD